MAKVLISIDDDILSRFDSYVASVGLNRSAFLSMAGIEYLNAREKAPLISSAFSSMFSLIDSRVKGEISQEDFQSRLDDLNNTVKRLKD